MATLESLIDQLASWKVNHVELYVEHTFAHPGFEEVWAAASPFTPAEIEHLDRFCAERFIELIPQQNTLGHMERYLIHPRFRPMALEPDGFTWLGFLPRPPATLDPRRDDAFELATRLVTDWCEVLPRARQVHVGLDEPWELGEELLGDYVAWMTRLRALPALDGRDVLVHGDVLACASGSDPGPSVRRDRHGVGLRGEPSVGGTARTPVRRRRAEIGDVRDVVVVVVVGSDDEHDRKHRGRGRCCAGRRWSRCGRQHRLGRLGSPPAPARLDARVRLGSGADMVSISEPRPRPRRRARRPLPRVHRSGLGGDGDRTG